MIFFDSAYIAKLYLMEPESLAVRARVIQEGAVCSSILARPEVTSVFHRKLREGQISSGKYGLLMDQFAADCADELWTWMPITNAILDSVEVRYRSLPANVFLRAADAIHLATAADAGMEEIYTNDRHLLAAAPHFGLVGSVIS